MTNVTDLSSGALGEKAALEQIRRSESGLVLTGIVLGETTP
jgi:hypothetical protein